MHILIAPNAFKNSLDAAKAAEAIEKGLQQSKLVCTTTCFPVADGGDGTGALLIRYLSGKLVQVSVHDPVGRDIDSSFGLVEEGRTAIIELADAAGLRLLKPAEYDPLHATTAGAGELMREAMNTGVKEIILCIGGSATIDAGTGILQALGVKFLDEKGTVLKDLPASLHSLAQVQSTETAFAPATAITILCDVENPLLGPNGAAAVFGPQKGATPEDVNYLDKCLTRFRDIVFQQTGKDMAELKHGGAAGGVAASLHTFFNARLVNGINYFLALTGFEQELAKADLVITGEGSIDVQTLQGKAPFGVAIKAKEYGKPVIGFGGKIAPDKSLQKHFDQLISINTIGADIETSLRDTYFNLGKTARLLGDELQDKGIAGYFRE